MATVGFKGLTCMLQVYYKSEQVPADWNARPVKILVGANFEEVAMDKSKHVFVKLCKHYYMCILTIGLFPPFYMPSHSCVTVC